RPATCQDASRFTEESAGATGIITPPIRISDGSFRGASDQGCRTPLPEARTEPLSRRRSPAPAFRLAAMGHAIAPARRVLAASADPLAGPFTLETGPATQTETRAGHVAGATSAVGVVLLRVSHLLSFR